MPPRGETFRRIRMPDEMWEAFNRAVQTADPELDRSKVIRQFIRYYIGETDEMPRRPGRRPARGQRRQAET